MNLSEKTSYLKGLLDGMDKNDKVINLIADILRDIALELEDQQDQIDEVCEVVDSISDDLDELEEDLYEDDEDYDDGDFDDDDDFDDEDDDDFEMDDDDLYEAVCPTCGDSILINKSMLEEGSINCPNCNELLEFDLEEDEDEE